MTTPRSLTRRQMLTATLGAAAGVLAVGTVASAMEDVIDGDETDSGSDADSDGVAANGANHAAAGELQTAERIVPTTTVPPVPAGMIAFPVDAADDCFVSDNFGACRGSGCSRRHEGLDIQGSRDANLIAVASGVLTKKYIETPGKTFGAGAGWTLYDEENDIVYKYFHMATHAPDLEEGDTVEFGQIIGTVGNTGTSGANTDSNYHLHFEYRPATPAPAPRPLLVRPDNCTFTP